MAISKYESAKSVAVAPLKASLASHEISKNAEIENTHGSLTVDLRVNPFLQRAQMYGASGLGFGTDLILILGDEQCSNLGVVIASDRSLCAMLVSLGNTMVKQVLRCDDVGMQTMQLGCRGTESEGRRHSG